MSGPRLRSVLAVVLLAAGAAAQTRVSLQSSGKRSELEVQVLKLGQESSRAAAHAALLAAGRAAVPLLVKAAQSDDATSMGALRVLCDLGGTARSAYPALQRLAAGSSPLARAAAHTAAQIGERDTVLVADWSGDRVRELDRDGKLLREVALDKVWRVQPVAGDHLLVCAYNDKVVREVDWDGKEHAVSKWPGGPIHAQRLLDGSMVVAESETNRVVHVGADGTTLHEFKLHTREFRVLPDDHLLLFDDQGQKLREVTLGGEVVRELAIGDNGLAFAPMQNGSVCIAYNNKLTELALGAGAGKDAPSERDLPFAGAFVAYSVAELRDGRFVLGENGKLTMRSATGDVLWHVDCGLASSVVPRLDVQDRR